MKGTLYLVFYVYPQSLQMYTWWQNKVLEEVNDLSRAHSWGTKPANCYSQGPHNSVSQAGWMPCEETKKFQYEATAWNQWLESFCAPQDISTISSSHYSNRKVARHCSVVQFKEECPLHRIDSSLGRNARGTMIPVWLRKIKKRLLQARNGINGRK